MLKLMLTLTLTQTLRVNKALHYYAMLFTFQQSEITKYDQIFEGLHPVNNLLAGDKVRPVSKLTQIDYLYV